jgi:hypothetical protein
MSDPGDVCPHCGNLHCCRKMADEIHDLRDELEGTRMDADEAAVQLNRAHEVLVEKGLDGVLDVLEEEGVFAGLHADDDDDQ